MRWVDLSTVFQCSMNSLNPVITVEAQFARHVRRAHRRRAAAHDVDRAGRRAAGDGLARPRRAAPLPARAVRRHEAAGRARAGARAATRSSCCSTSRRPGSTSSSSATILDRLRELQRELGFAVLFISHDLGTVMEMADRVMVMYAGRDRRGPARGRHGRRAPLHPYTAGLLGSYADPRDEVVEVAFIPGRPPDLSRAHAGCLFEPRCPVAVDACRTEHPELAARRPRRRPAACSSRPRPRGAPRRGSRGAARAAGRGLRRGRRTHAVARTTSRCWWSTTSARPTGSGADCATTTTQAVDDVSFALRPGRVSALVGQSGCGKTTIARLVTGVERPDQRRGSGSRTRRSTGCGRRALRGYRRHVQLVFQDPFSALNPTRTVALRAQPAAAQLPGHGRASRPATRAAELLETVGLSPADQYLDKLPHQLSGGQRQRVVIARALAPEPEVLVADEPISMLDVSIRAEILELLDQLVRDRRHRDALHHPRPAQRPAARRRGDGAEQGRRGRARPDARGDPVGEGPLHADAAARRSRGRAQRSQAVPRPGSRPCRVERPAGGEQLATPAG